MFADTIRCSKCVCRMYGKPTYTKLNSLDMILFHSNINVHQAGYSMLLVASFPPFRALEFLLLAKHRWKRIFKEPIIRHSVHE